jgi:hypothetical protein
MTTAEILASRLRLHLAVWSARADEELLQLEGDAPSLYVTDEGRWSLQRDDLPHAAPARVRDVLEHLEPRVEEMARSEAERLETAVRAFVPPKLRAAVVARLKPEWPWSRVLATSDEVERDHGFTLLHVLAWHAARTRGVMEPPVSEIDRADAIRRTLAIVDPSPPDASEKQIDEWLRRHPLAPDAGVWTVESASGRHLLSRTQLAWVCSAEARVEADRRRPAFPVAANRHIAAGMSALTGRHAAPTGKITADDPTDRRDRTLTIRAELHGRAHHELELQLPTRDKRVGQLLLPGTGTGTQIDPERLADILQRVAGVDAFSDLMILSRMAAAHGGRGRLTWTWEEHRHKTFYEDRRRNGHSGSDADMARAVWKRLKTLSALVLYECERDDQGNVYRRRLGPFGMIDMPESITTKDDAPLHVEVRLNPTLVGLTADTKNAGFVLVETSALHLEPHHLALYLRILFAGRRTADPALRMKAETMWQHLGLQGSKPYRWPAHAAAVTRALDKIAAVDGMSWSGEGKGPSAIYTLTAAAWRDDRVLHRVPPVLAAPSTAQLPIEGAALKDWRKAAGLTLDQLAALLKKSGCRRASRATVNRVELTGSVVPTDWRRALAVLRGAAGR